jgi:Na+/H+ antiporter NhaC
MDLDVKETEGVPERWINAVLPILVVIVGTVWGLIETGRMALIESGVTDPTIFASLKEGNSFVALLWSSFAGALVAVAMTVIQRLMTLRATVDSLVAGIRAMSPAMVILVLAWAIGAVCTDLHTADYLVASLSGVIAPQLLPMLIFLVAGAVSFSTGTSRGTMTILTPLCVPLVIQVSQVNELALVTQNSVLLASVSAILSGAVFGDHCSPISDTTIMSSMASNSDHVDHVRTQLPYAMVVALISMVLGYAPVALGLPAWSSMIAGAVAVFAIIRFFGKSPEVQET